MARLSWFSPQPRGKDSRTSGQCWGHSSPTCSCLPSHLNSSLPAFQPWPGGSHPPFAAFLAYPSWRGFSCKGSRERHIPGCPPSLPAGSNRSEAGPGWRGVVALVRTKLLMVYFSPGRCIPLRPPPEEEENCKDASSLVSENTIGFSWGGVKGGAARRRHFRSQCFCWLQPSPELVSSLEPT